MIRRFGFTMLELVFVIVVMGIIGKFGVEFLAQAYKSFIFSSVNHNLQSSSEMAVETIAAKLQFRIKDSVIARKSDDSFTAIGSASGDSYKLLEWVGSDIDNFRGDTSPNWSAIIDISQTIADGTNLISPASDTSAMDNLIKKLSNNSTGIDNAAIYFVGSDSSIDKYGWEIPATAFTDQSKVMHPIKSVAGDSSAFAPTVGTFSGVDIYEYYQLAWTAYAVGITDYASNSGTLMLYYNYKPWEGETYKDGSSSIIMENVSTFRFKSVGSVIKIQVCTKDDLVEDYSLCKEKTIY
jgi:type II secretory pathway pseudopilin PulG